MDADFIQSIKDKKLKDKETQEMLDRHSELLSGNENLQRAILDAAKATIESSVSHRPDVMVQNFPDTLATSEDIQALLEAFRQTQVETQETTEKGTESVESVMKEVLASLQRLEAKDHESAMVNAINSIEMPDSLEISNIDDMGDFFFSLQQAVEEKETVVNVDAPDFSELKAEMAELKQAVREIQMPEIPETVFPTELFMGMLSEMQSQRLILEKILARPIPVGSGGALASAATASTPSDPDDAVDNIELQNGDDLLLQDDSFLLTQ